MKQLLILGNGFDLQAKLPSTYNDFFEERIPTGMQSILDNAFDLYDEYESRHNHQKILKKTPGNSIDIFLNKSIDTIVNYFSEVETDEIKLADLTFWDLYLYFLKNVNDSEWHIIEQQIHAFLAGTHRNNMNSMDIFFNGKVTFGSQIATVISSYYASSLPTKKYDKNTSYIDFLQNELTLLEKAFSMYLKNAIEKTPFYHENSRKLVASLATGAKYLLQLENNTINSDLLQQFLDELIIINFNYTDPIEFSNRIHSPDDNVNGERLLSQIPQVVWNGINNRTLHVHGSISEKNTIFGIDSTNIETADSIYKFTKTYKQLVGNYGADAVPTKIPDKYSTDVLAFYGHSLSPLDYSYFQSLFDYYSIYDSNIHLIFYYSVYGVNPDFDSIRQAQVDRVLNLLSSYAKTITNKDHGKNLIPKLSLEQRMSVVQLLPTQQHWHLINSDGHTDPMFKRL